MKLFIPVLMMFALVLGACEKKEDAATTEPAEGAEATKTETAEPAAPENAAESGASADAKVEVTAEGTKFDPPVKPEQIPDGAWYCDMGTVEYASLEKGDGKCPTCGMMLKQKGAAAPADDGHGHDHEGGHDGHEH